MRRKRRQRTRRGSTLVMVAFMLVAIMAVTAIALDMGRFFVVNNELQTALDAGALAGADYMHGSKESNAAKLQDSIRAHVTSFIATNYKVDNAAYSVADTSIRIGFWDAGYTEPRFDYATMVPPRKPNAVVIRWRKEAPVIFAGIIGQSSPTLWKRSVAWVAQLQSENCVKPWAFPYTGLYNAIENPDILPGPPTGPAAPDFSQANLNAFLAKPAAQRRLIFLGQDVVPPTGTPTTDGWWNGYSFAANNGQASFSLGVGQADCIPSAAYRVNTAVNGNTITASGGSAGGVAVDVSCKSIWMNRGVNAKANGCGNQGPPADGTGICYQAAVNDARCYASAGAAALGQVGTEIAVSFGDHIGNGPGGIDFRVVGRGKVMCYFVEPSEGSTCSTGLPDGKPNVTYPAGTMVIEIMGLGVPEIAPETVLGSQLSLEQRLLLVK